MTTATGPEPLVQALSRIQAERCYTTTGMAQMIGVDKSTWSVIRRGLIQPGDGFRMKAVRAFPELFHLLAARVLGIPDSSGANGEHDAA